MNSIEEYADNSVKKYKVFNIIIYILILIGGFFIADTLATVTEVSSSDYFGITTSSNVDTTMAFIIWISIALSYGLIAMVINVIINIYKQNIIDTELQKEQLSYIKLLSKEKVE